MVILYCERALHSAGRSGQVRETFFPGKLQDVRLTAELLQARPTSLQYSRAS